MESEKKKKPENVLKKKKSSPEPSFLSKLRTPSADTAAMAPSQHPAIVAGSVTSPCQISAPSFDRKLGAPEEAEEEVAAAAAASEAADGDFASFFGLTMALTRNFPLFTSSFTVWLPMWPVAPATTTSGRWLFEEALFFVDGIDGQIDRRGKKKQSVFRLCLFLFLCREQRPQRLCRALELRAGNGGS